MTSQASRVAVVGGGIGGMAAANAMIRRGIDVTVYEQAPALGEIGAGVLITPNSLRLLERMGMGDALERSGARIGVGSQYYRKDGTLVAPILTTDSSGWNGMYGVHRADLLTILADSLPDGVIKTDHKCIGFEQDEHLARLSFKNDAEVEANIVIAADGIQSVLRRYVVPPSAPVHSGSVAYRGLIPAADLPWWPKGVSQLWMGDGKHFLVYPVRSGELINYVGFVPSGEHPRESWSARRPRRTSRGILRLGSACDRTARPGEDYLLVGPVRPGTAGEVDQRAADPARRRSASDAPAPWARGQPVDRRRCGAREQAGRRDKRNGAGVSPLLRIDQACTHPRSAGECPPERRPLRLVVCRPRCAMRRSSPPSRCAPGCTTTTPKNPVK